MGMRELVRERVREWFKYCGAPKTVNPGSTGQTGCSYLSDRSRLGTQE